MSRSDLAAEHILEVPNHWKVEYLAIGAFAAIAQRAPLLAPFDVNLAQAHRLPRR